MSQGTRRLAAIMFTDIVGFTSLGQKNEDLALLLLEEHRSLVRPILRRHNGREVKTIGDAFLAEFPNALDGVRCAYEIQRATREHNFSEPEQRRIHLRIGVHLGDIVESGGDISGDAVNVASRIEPLAETDGVVISRQVRDNVQNKFELSFVDLGEKSLKNVTIPVEIFKIRMPWESEVSHITHQPDERRLAVLPFTSMSPDPNDEFFADGLTEELIDKLCRIKEFEVIARTSAMSYKKKDKKAREIGRELGVGSLVEGSVRKAGNRIRVTAQLVRAENEGHIWSSTYDRNLEDIFAVQSDIAEKVADALRVSLLPKVREAVEKKPTSSKEAYMMYLKGRYYWNERTPKASKLAVDYFQKAIEEDPSFALAYSGLADAYTIIGDQGGMSAREAGNLTKSFAEKALELDPALAEAHASLANVLGYVYYEWERAELEFKRAIELNPAYPTARQWYGKHLSFLGRFEECVEQHWKAMQLDPFSMIINTNYAEGLIEAGRYEEGIEQGKKTVALDPDFLIGHFEFGIFYLGGGEHDKAEEQFRRSLEISPGFPAATSLLSYCLSLSGRKDEAEALLKQLNEMTAYRYVSPASIGLAEFGLGMKDDAFRHLDEAYDNRDSWLLYFRPLPAFKRLVDDPRYQVILRKMGLDKS